MRFQSVKRQPAEWKTCSRNADASKLVSLSTKFGDCRGRPKGRSEKWQKPRWVEYHGGSSGAVSGVIEGLILAISPSLHKAPFQARKAAVLRRDFQLRMAKPAPNSARVPGSGMVAVAGAGVRLGSASLRTSSK